MYYQQIIVFVHIRQLNFIFCSKNIIALSVRVGHRSYDMSHGCWRVFYCLWFIHYTIKFFCICLSFIFYTHFTINRLTIFSGKNIISKNTHYCIHIKYFYIYAQSISLYKYMFLHTYKLPFYNICVFVYKQTYHYINTYFLYLKKIIIWYNFTFGNQSCLYILIFKYLNT